MVQVPHPFRVTEKISSKQLPEFIRLSFDGRAVYGASEGQLELAEQFDSVPDLNKVLLQLHALLPENGTLAVSGKTLCDKRKSNNELPALIRHVIWIWIFVFHRLLPKMKITRGPYELLYSKKRLYISKAEILGRLVYCGFSIVSCESRDKKHFIVAKKAHAPKTDIVPSYGPIFKMQRVGQHGKIIGVYKLRTMHPYSEFLQEYMIKQNGYSDDGTGKIANDFRVLTYGAALRKIWLDELPQLINVVRGEMSLVGVRPLSKARYNEFPDDLKKLRVKYKPGCFPPYVALLMGCQNGNIEAERIYLLEKEKHPIRTNFKYLLLSIRNILTNKIRSC